MTRQHEFPASHRDDPEGLARLGERVGAQISAMRAWSRHAEATKRAPASAVVVREHRADARARRESLLRTQQAMVDRTSRPVDDTFDLFMSGKALALVVHPSAWMRGKLWQGLTDLGLEVLATCADGAEGLGIAIVEQPDLVLLDDRISSSTGLELLGDLRTYSHAMVAAQVEDERQMGAMLDGGASAVFSRRVPPAVMVEAVSALVSGRATLPVQVR
jgi:CheY-like chemotaxis protein